MVVKTGVTDDARIRRVAGTVARLGHAVTVIGDRPGPEDPIEGVDIRHVRGPRTRGSLDVRDPARRAARWALLPTYRRRDDRAFAAGVAAIASDYEAEIVHAHDLSGLRAAQPLIGDGCRLVYDAHECWSGRKLEGRPAPLIRRRDRADEQRLGGAAAVKITVSAPLARWFEETYGWPKVEVVRNTFSAAADRGGDLSPNGVFYAGLIDFKRDLPTIVDGVAAVPGVGLTVRGSGDVRAITWLRDEGVTVREPLPVDELADEYRSHGIGVVALNDNSINHRVALPNKLFQSVQSGVPVVASDLPAIRDLVTSHRLGALFTPGDAESFAVALRTVVDNYTSLRTSVLAAQPALSWEEDEKVLETIYSRFTS